MSTSFNTNQSIALAICKEEPAPLSPNPFAIYKSHSDAIPSIPFSFALAPI